MRGASSKKHIGRRNKKTSRHLKGAKTTPTMKEQERWDDITGAYGNLPGVEPVRSTPMDGAGSEMRMQQQQQQQMEQESPQGTNQNLIVNDDDNNLITTNNVDNNQNTDEQLKEAVDLDSLVNTDSVKGMITPRRGGEEKEDVGDIDEGKKE